MRYRLNTPAVASQIIGGEAILIHFDSGRYYTVEGSGADIIASLERGRSVEQTIADWAPSGGAAIAEAVDRFARALLDEQLIVPRQNGDGDGAGSRDEPPSPAPFRAPALTTYTDLEDLLRLDPIHDVDDAGWPIPKVV